MQNTNKINILIEQLQLEPQSELALFLEKSTLDKVIVDKLAACWTFHILANEYISAQTYLELVHKLQDSFPYQVDVKFSVPTAPAPTGNFVYQYLNVFLREKFLDATFLVQAMAYAGLHFEQNTLRIACADIAHKNKFTEKSSEIENLFATVGIDLRLKVNIGEKEAEKFAVDLVSHEIETQRETAEEIKALTDNVTKAGQHGTNGNTNISENGEKRQRRQANTTFNAKTAKNKQNINEIHNVGETVFFEGYVFDKEVRKTRNGKFILTLKVTDYTDSIYVTKWLNDEEEMAEVKKGTWLYILGKLEIDPYKKNERSVRLTRYEVFEKEIKRDNAPKKRIELHAHTKMSQLDGVISAEELINRALQYEHEAVAVTDHAVAHSFPNAYNASGRNGKIKVLYGCEFNVVDYSETDIFYPKYDTILQQDINEPRYIVFDIETTGLSQNFNKIIEIAAVKIEKGLNVDTYETFVNPEELLTAFTTELTSIRQQDVDHAPHIREAMAEFLAWCTEGTTLDNVIFVAHNAHFDVPFIQAVYKKINRTKLAVNFLDTLQMARYLYPQLKRHGLKALTKFFSVTLDQHHRAIADTRATADVFVSMLNELKRRGINDIVGINSVVTPEKAHEIAYSYHVNVLAKNEVGLKNLFKLISYAHVDYFVREARIPLAVLNEHADGLLFGSACQNNNVFQSYLSYDEAHTLALMEQYDYIEVQPPHHYVPLLYSGVFKGYTELQTALDEFIRLARSTGKPVVATGDVHQLDERDTLIRQIYISTQTGTHPLARKEIKEIPATHLLTTDEMKAAFAFLDDRELIDEIVVENTHVIADMIEPIEVIKNKLFTPTMDNVEENVRSLVYSNAYKTYGETLPKIIVDRIETELASIIGHGFAVIYYICHLIIKKSLDDGYIVGSRGSVGSSLVATLMEITEVNPMPPHYVCPHCHYSEFHGGEVGSGFDLPNKDCPECGHKNMHKDGHDIPFETFLGFDGDKVPDIDLNFSGEYQPKAHDYTKVLFGEENVYRAGTISTIADKTAYGYVRGYLTDHPEMNLSMVEVDRLTAKVAGVKKTTGKHAGGVIVVPKEMEIYDITPVQYPADGKTGKDWKTTHFDFHAIHDNLLKLDLLGHDDPTIIRMLQDLSGIAPKEIPLDDADVYSLFYTTKALDLQKPIASNTGSLGLPEFGTEFVRQMLEQTKPSTFAELLQISGLSHGTDVWLNNAQVLVQNGTCELKDVIGCRDDIMVYLIYKGLNPSDAFQIMETTRKGKFTTGHTEYIEKMRAHDVPEWYIDSCTKIKYMFPKAHAAAYVMSAIRIAWFKVHKPLYFYASLFSVRHGGKSFEIETIMGGYEVVKARIAEIDKMESPTNKDIDTKGILDLVLEMQARGLGFKQVDLYTSDSRDFLVDKEEKNLIFPFQSVDGLGENVANLIVKERVNGNFLSKEDLRKRTGVSKTVLAKLEILRVLEELDDHNQMSLF